MKKIYLAPEMKQTIVSKGRMICVSLTSGGNARLGGIKEADVRGRDVFDFEDASVSIEDGSDWDNGLW